MSPEDRELESVNKEKIVLMKGVKKHHAIQGILAAVTITCGMLLFCLMGSRESGDKRFTTNILAFIGGLSVLFVITIEIRVLLSKRGAWGGRSRVPSEPVGFVSEMSNIWLFMAVVMTTAYCGLFLAYAINPHGGWWVIANFVLPIVKLVYILSFFMKPLRKDRFYIRYVLPGHFFNAFIVDTLLTSGSACLTTLGFLDFEYATCLIEEEDASYCNNTANAALCLSIFLVVATLMQIAQKTVPTSIRMANAMTKEKVASFDLNGKETVQAACFSFTGVSALFLLSSLGIPGEPNQWNFWVGTIGALVLLLAAGIEMKEITRTKVEEIDATVERHLNALNKLGESRRFSGGQLSEGMAMGGLL